MWASELSVAGLSLPWRLLPRLRAETQCRQTVRCFNLWFPTRRRRTGLGLGWWRGQDSNLRSLLRQRFYRPPVLAAHPPLRIAELEPEGGFEPTNLPITSRLRYHCATRARFPSPVGPIPFRHNKSRPPTIGALSIGKYRDWIRQSQLGWNTQERHFRGCPDSNSGKRRVLSSAACAAGRR